MRQESCRWSMVHFFGPDGAGKTTHVHLLARYLRRHGMQVRKVWIRSPHTGAFLLSRLLLALGIYRSMRNPSGRLFRQPAVHRDAFIRCLWVLVELMSVLPLIYLRVFHQRRSSQVIVAERYLVDTIVTIAFFLDDMGFLQSAAARFLGLFIPRDTLFVFLDADYLSILDRRGEIAEPEEFIEFQRKAYRVLAADRNVLTIYTPKLGIEETHSLIREAFLGGQRSSVQRRNGPKPQTNGMQGLGSREGQE